MWSGEAPTKLVYGVNGHFSDSVYDIFGKIYITD
jgi:hypothetical protein